MRGGDTTLSKCTKCHKSQPFDVTEGLVVAQAHHAHDIINPYFTNKNTWFSLKASLVHV